MNNSDNKAKEVEIGGASLKLIDTDTFEKIISKALEDHTQDDHIYHCKIQNIEYFDSAFGPHSKMILTITKDFRTKELLKNENGQKN